MTTQWQPSPEPGWTPPLPPHTEPEPHPTQQHPSSRPTMTAVETYDLSAQHDRFPIDGEEPDSAREKQERDPVTRFLIEWVPLMVGAMLFAFLVRSFLFTAYEIPSQSMVPTLNINDRVIVNRMSYDFHSLNRGDVIVFDRPENLAGDTDVLIKRVIGLPGETVTLRDGNVYIDDMLMVESYIADQNSTFSLGPIPGCDQQSNNVCTIPDDHVLVMGDNRYKSSDGRVFGPIHADDIVGRAFVKIWPLNDVGGL